VLGLLAWRRKAVAVAGKTVFAGMLAVAGTVVWEVVVRIVV
jgi:hypothetical protein